MKGIKLLLWKNYRILSRQKLSVLMELLLPLIFMLVFVFGRAVIKTTKFPEVTYDPFPANAIPHTVRMDAHILMYAPSTDLTDTIMEILLQKYFIHQGLNYSVEGFSGKEEMEAAYIDHATKDTSFTSRGPVLAGIIFENLVSPKRIPENIKITVKFPCYQRTEFLAFLDRINFPPSWMTRMLYPITIFSGPRSPHSQFGGFPGYFEEGFLYVQNAVSSVISTLLLNGTQLEEFESYNFQLQRFPHRAYESDKFNQASELWVSFIVGVGYVLSVMSITRAVIHEKVTRLKEFMKIMGLPSWMHWTAWFTRAYAILLVIALIVTITCKIDTKYGAVFPNSNPIIIFLIFAAYGLVIITYAFLMSSIFFNEDAGATAAAMVWIISFLPFYIFYLNFFVWTRAHKIWTCLLMPNMPITYALFIAGLFEANGEGAQWATLFDDKIFCIGDNLLMMLLDAAIYMILALYFELAIPGTYGNRLPWYYPFTWWFWFGGGKEGKQKGTTKIRNIKPDAFEDDPTNLKVGIHFRGLSKVYGTKVAVSSLNLKLYHNQVTGLLGHNGAGKTTTMSILTGLIRPSGGTAIVNSRDISKNMNEIRKSLGFCPQYNILFNNLTVAEHLEFYCRLKGMSQSQIIEETDRVLGVLGLEDKRHTISKNLSGGMKRKLCVGIAFSAGTNVVLLDEPTAGMDPEARRSTWDIIQSEKSGKTVLLSTHYMEEADLLSDRVAIMVSGNLYCCGSPLFLKTKYGGTYKLTMVLRENAKVQDIKQEILTRLPDVDFNQVGAELSCYLPMDKMDLYPTIFDDLEKKKEELGVGSYGVGSSTLEEVFVKVGELVHDGRDGSNAGNKTKAAARSIAMKSTSSINNQPATSNSVVSLVDSRIPLYRPDQEKYEGLRLIYQQFKAMLIKRVLLNIRNWSVPALQILAPTLVMTFIMVTSRNCPAVETPSALDISFQRYEYDKLSTVPISCPNTSHLCNTLKSCMKSSRFVRDVDDSMHDYLLAQQRKSKSTMDSDIIVAYEESESDNGKTVTGLFNNQIYHTPALALSVWFNNLLKAVGVGHKISVTNHPFEFLIRDYLRFHLGINEAFLMAHGICLALPFLSSSFLILPVTERVSQSKHMQLIYGVRLPLYWFADFIVSAAVCFVSGATIVLVLTIFDVKDYQDWDMKGNLMMFFMAFGWATIPFAMFLSLFFKSPATAYSRTLAAHLLFACFASFLTAYFEIPELDLEKVGSTLHDIGMVLPAFCVSAAARGIGRLHRLKKSCGQFDIKYLCHLFPDSPCCRKLHNSYFAWESYGVGKEMVSLLALGCVGFALLIVAESGVIQKILARIEKAKSRKSGFGNSFGTRMELMDVDVANEDRRISHSTILTLCKTDNLVVKGLTKVYNGKFRAVDHINVGVKKGEIFGLLGLNGAGKTTTFKMLTGDTWITSGDAYINSFSVKDNPRQAYSYLGYCPQFDALLDNLTGRETLMLFARIKGIAEKNIPALIDRVSSTLLFSKFLDQQAGSYSGGNKRKLSTAVAMLGDPALIFLDEPTAGMDPVARRHVWDAISWAVRDSGASVVLTSHNMEECEALCSSLAIMVQGKFKCLGSPQHLKSKLCPGYKLMAQIPYVNLEGNNTIDVRLQDQGWETRSAEFDEFLNKKFPGCELDDSHPGFAQYHLPGHSSWAHIFAAMEEARQVFQLAAYSVGQVDLEQVFFNIAQESCI